ncbi:hypothetical protein F1847_06770 [Thermodesulfobacterium sp. TA1]|uniref:ATP synthase subunit I n=1 Tax=Thermodesulfobacterium sp. TA1 TaxID=2234087 RepID=UPI001232A237|nr:ATP synthase subunit I [Thermodesulfobacterium sp. TA1]QER42462.1 hypothetical protein F1847_06770 [Thermodesulfobacterium sp. TA1]
MIKEVSPERFFGEAERLILGLVILFTILVYVLWGGIGETLSFLAGGFLGFLNFRTTKKEGIAFVKKIQEILLSDQKNLYNKERHAYIAKIYLKLLATAIVIYFLIAHLRAHPVFLVSAFVLVYFSLTAYSFIRFILWMRKEKKEILA